MLLSAGICCQLEQRFVQSVNAVTVDAFRRLRLNLDDLAVLPRKAFGLGIAERAGVGEELGALSMEPKIKIGVVADWNPSIRRSPGFCPTFTVRRLLRTELESSLVKFVSRQQNEALNSIWKQLDETLCYRWAPGRAFKSLLVNTEHLPCDATFVSLRLLQTSTAERKMRFFSLSVEDFIIQIFTIASLQWFTFN
jgi:hypothetical protein